MAVVGGLCGVLLFIVQLDNGGLILDLGRC